MLDLNIYGEQYVDTNPYTEQLITWANSFALYWIDYQNR